MGNKERDVSEKNETRTLVLPSGKEATIRPGKGKHLLAAQRIAKDSDSIAFALIAELVDIDGKRIFYEDLLDMDLPDVMVLATQVLGNFPSALLGASST